MLTLRAAQSAFAQETASAALDGFKVLKTDKVADMKSEIKLDKAVKANDQITLTFVNGDSTSTVVASAKEITVKDQTKAVKASISEVISENFDKINADKFGDFVAMTANRVIVRAQEAQQRAEANPKKVVKKVDEPLY